MPSPHRSEARDVPSWPTDRVGAVLAIVDDIVEMMLTVKFPSLGPGRLRQPHDLAALDADDWQRALDAADVPPPPGITRENHARALAMEVAGAYSEAAFRYRATTVPDALDEAWKLVLSMIERGPHAIGSDLDDADFEGVADDDRQVLRSAHALVRELANGHPGLGLAQLFSRGGAGAADVAAERLGWVHDVLALNPDVSFLELDYLPDSLELATVDFGDLSGEARSLVMAELKAQQRIHAVTRNPIASGELMRAGYHSASSIATASPDELASAAGMPVSEARAYRCWARLQRLPVVSEGGLEPVPAACS